jgi:LmbE family N-acetylglucosaminyl deacetylase
VQEHNIKAMFTFDEHGISGHINHRTIYHALKKMETTERKEKREGEAEG